MAYKLDFYVAFLEHLDQLLNQRAALVLMGDFDVSEDLAPHVKRACIQQEVMGSDHCPVGIEPDV